MASREASAPGVPSGGAGDWWSLAVANLLAGNAPDDSAIEVTLVGPQLAVVRTCVVAITGADLGALVPEEGRRLVPAQATSCTRARASNSRAGPTELGPISRSPELSTCRWSSARAVRACLVGSAGSKAGRFGPGTC